MTAASFLSFQGDAEEGGAELKIENELPMTTLLFRGNQLRRQEWEKSQLTSKWWEGKQVITDLDSTTFKPLKKDFVDDEEFYNDPVNEDPGLLISDFFTGYSTGQWFIGLVDNPCVLGAANKSRLMAADSRQQQLRHGLGQIGSLLLFQPLSVTVRRNHLVEDALNSVSSVACLGQFPVSKCVLVQLIEAQSAGSYRNLRAQLKVRFHGEEGVDEGGVAKEFFQLLVEQLFNPDYGMFRYMEETRNFWFVSQSYESLVQFELIGIILGLALYNQIILDVQFPLVLYKKLLSACPRWIQDSPAAPRIPSASPPPTRSSPQDADTAVDDRPTRSTDATSNVSVIQSDPSNSPGVVPNVQPPPQAPFGILNFTATRGANGTGFVITRRSTQPPAEFAEVATLTDKQLVGFMAKSLPPFEPIIDDLDELYPSVARGLRQLLMMRPEEVETLQLTFSVTVTRFGDLIEEPLPVLEGQSYTVDTPVTGVNREVYVKATLQYYLVTSIAREFEAFWKGFHRCCGGPVLRRFSSQELNLAICGVPGDLDFDDLQSGTTYADGYTTDSPQILWFWEFVRGLPQEDKKKLLFFITGSDRVPVSGLKSLHLNISKAGGEQNR